LNPSERANQARIKRLTEAFNVFDQEANNTIPSSELGTVVRSLGLVPTEGELQDILSEVRHIDKNKKKPEKLFLRCLMIQIQNRFI
jgi:calmodulin